MYNYNKNGGELFMKIAICDDNTEYIRLIAGLVAPYKEKYQMDLKTFESGEEFLKWDEPFDIIFLDIEMKTVSGIDVAAKLRAENDDAIIIFITSHSNYVSDTFRLGAFQYLTKPFTEADFKLDFERAINTYMSKHKKFAVRFRDEITLLECQDIFFIEAYDRHLHIITSDKQYDCIESNNVNTINILKRQVLAAVEGALAEADYLKSALELYKTSVSESIDSNMEAANIIARYSDNSYQLAGMNASYNLPGVFDSAVNNIDVNKMRQDNEKLGKMNDIKNNSDKQRDMAFKMVVQNFSDLKSRLNLLAQTNLQIFNFISQLNNKFDN